MPRLFASFFTSLAFAGATVAQSTAFTYQGELKSNGTLVGGLHDFRFRLFDAATAGTQVGTQLCADNVSVTNGKFTTTIDFGQQFASTAARFLEFELRRDTGLNSANATGFLALSLRQAITPAPRATAASVANAHCAPDGSPTNAVFVDNAGSVGIGTATPGHSVTVAKPAPTLALQHTDSTGTAGGLQIGYISYRDSGNVERAWVGYGSTGDPDFSIINVRPGGDIVLNPFNGNVGIGTPSPTAKLDVRGDIRLGSAGELFATGSGENLRIICGSVDPTGAILNGTGFSVTRNDLGSYTIFFTVPSSSVPALIANAHYSATDDIERLAAVDLRGSSQMIVRISSDSTGGRSDGAFSFMAIGPR